MSDEDWQDISVAPIKGILSEVFAGSGGARLFRIECGEYGTFTFTVQRGGSFQMMYGTTAPRIAFTDANVDTGDADNIISIDNQG